ncbi:uncharacterized protein [Montipora capricornis]|uniref:uncharacterized protein n=1 Tax=Montipora capricornis TaxID=246305 RepID=UPI0035F1B2EB
MGDPNETYRASNQLFAPVEDISQNFNVGYPSNMKNDEIQGESEGDWDERENDDEIIQRGERYSLLEAQKGLTVFTAAVFIIGEMAGSGVLALPSAIVGAGWTGIALLILCCFASGYCGMVLGRSWTLLRERHEEYRGHVRYPYPAIGEKAYGRWASIAVTVCIQITLLGVCVVFLILAAGNMSNLVKLHVSDHTELRIWLLICFAVLLPLSWLGTPKEFWGIAIGASVATAVACLMICICIVLDIPADLNSVEQPTVRFESFFSAFGTILFSFGGASTFPTIQTDMKKASRFPLSVVFAYIVVISMYLPVSVLGFVAYGKDIKPNILDSVKNNEHSVAAVTLDIVLALITLHLLSSFVIVLNPVSQQFEEFLNIPRHFCFKRCLFRSGLMCLILGISEAFPKFGPILSLIGGSTVTLLTFVFPCLFYLQIERNIPLHIRALLYEIIAVGVFGGVASTYSAINDIRKVFT